MAITGKLLADFSDFTRAVQTADVQLKGFETSASKVGTSLTRMVDSFSGRKIISDATLMAKAIEDIGGPAKLTATELQRVGTIANEAAEKLKAMGKDVPPGIQKIADEAAKLTTSLKTAGSETSRTGGFFNDLKTQIIGTAAGFVTGQAVISGLTQAFGALQDAISGSIAFGSHIDDLAKGTNISVGAVQALGFAAKRVGMDMDGAAQMVGMLSKRIATGDDSAVAAVQSLGLNWRDLRTLKPDELFLKVGDAVQRIQDPLAQAGVASQLFGKSYEGALRLINDNLRETMTEAKATGAVLGDDAIKSLDTFGDKVGDVTLRVKVFTAQALSPLLDKLLSMLAINAQTNKTTFIDPEAEAQFKKFGAAVGGASDAAKGYGIGLTITGAAAKALADGQTTLLTSTQLVENRIKALREAALEPLSDEQKRQILELKQWGENEKTIAELLGTSTQAVHRFLDAQKPATKETKDHTKALQEAALGYKTYVDAALPLVGLLPDLSARSGAFRDGLDNLSSTLNEFHDGLTVAGDTLTTVVIPAFSTLPNVVPQGTRAIADATKVVDTLGEHLLTTFTDLPDTLIRALEGGGNLAGAFQSFAVQLGKNFGKTVSDEISKAMEAGTSVFNKVTVGAGGAAGAVAGLGAAFSGASGKAAAASAALAGVEVGMLALGTGTVATVGGAVALGAATAGIGLAAVGAYFAIKNLLHSTEQDINPLRQKFVDAAGGLDVLNEHAHTVGLTLDKLLNAKNAQQYNTAIQELNTAFQKFDKNAAEATTDVNALLKAAQTLGLKIPDALKPGIQALIDMKLVTGDTAALFASLTGQNDVDFKTMQATAEKYGIKLEALGPAFQSARLHDASSQIINDFDTLVKNGADADKVLAGMKDEIGKLVADSIKFGVAIPENMRPWIEQLVKTHQLIDENGDQITDLSKLNFADPIVSEFDKIVAKLQELIDKIPDIGKAFGQIPKDYDFNFRVNVPDLPRASDTGGAATGGLVTSQGVAQYLGTGGRVLSFFPRGTDTVPAMLTPGERVLSVKQTRAFDAAGGLGALQGRGTVVDFAALRAEILGLRQQLATDARRAPDRLAIAVRDALLQNGRR
jgi:hypothetical protein